MGEQNRFKPNAAALLRVRDKRALDEQLDEALDNSALDAAIAKVAPRLRPGEDPLYYDIRRRLSSPSLTPAPSTDVDETTLPGTSTPEGESTAESGTAPAASPDPGAAAPGSPWANGKAGGDIDRAALPSAMAPSPAPPTSVPIPPAARRPAGIAALSGLPVWVKGVLAVFAVFAPTTLALMVGRTIANSGRAPASSSVIATTAASSAPVVAPSAPGTVVPVVPTPTAPSSSDAGAVPAPSASATMRPAVPSGSGHPHAPSRAGLDDDPYSSAPSATATVEPAPPASASSAPPPPPKGGGDIF
jgi:hypothetical protein